MNVESDTIELAKRWRLAVEDMRDRANSATCNVGPEPLSERDLGELMGRVGREMEREVYRRERAARRAASFGRQLGLGEPADWLLRSGALELVQREMRSRGEDPWDGDGAFDREALAHRIMQKLEWGPQPYRSGGDPDGAFGLAWTLCEAAGWPS